MMQLGIAVILLLVALVMALIIINTLWRKYREACKEYEGMVDYMQRTEAAIEALHHGDVVGNALDILSNHKTKA